MRKPARVTVRVGAGQQPAGRKRAHADLDDFEREARGTIPDDVPAEVRRAMEYLEDEARFFSDD